MSRARLEKFLMSTGSIGDVVEDADDKVNETFAPTCVLELTATMHGVVAAGSVRRVRVAQETRSVVQHTGSTMARPSQGSFLLLHQLVA